MSLTRRTVLTAISAAAAAQAQRPRVPNWKPKLGVLCQYSDANLAFVKAEGFTSMQLRLDPDKLDDAAIASIKDKIAKALYDAVVKYRRSLKGAATLTVER